MWNVWNIIIPLLKIVPFSLAYNSYNTSLIFIAITLLLTLSPQKPRASIKKKSFAHFLIFIHSFKNFYVLLINSYRTKTKKKEKIKPKIYDFVLKAKWEVLENSPFTLSLQNQKASFFVFRKKINKKKKTHLPFKKRWFISVFFFYFSIVKDQKKKFKLLFKG